MVSIDSNVTAFNEFDTLQMDSIMAIGGSSIDVMVNLFKEYLAAPDKEFSLHKTEEK